MRGKPNLAHFMAGRIAPPVDADTDGQGKKRREQGEKDVAEAKEDWKRGSFWVTPGLVVALAGLMVALTTLAHGALEGVRDDIDRVRDDLGAQIRQTEARLDKKIDSKTDSLKEAIVENRNRINILETKVDRIMGHLMGPADRDG